MLQTNFEKVKTDLEKVANAYEYYTNLVKTKPVADDIKAGGKHLSKGMISNIESAFHDHVPSDLLNLLLVIKFSGVAGLTTRTTGLERNGKYFEGYDVKPALQLFNTDAEELQRNFDQHVTDELLVKLVDSIGYYRNILEKNLGELEVLFIKAQ